MKKIFLLLLFLILEGCLVLGAPHDDRYIVVKNDDKIESNSSVVVNSFPKMKVVNYIIKKSENLSKPDSVSVYFKEVNKLFSLDSVKENDDYIIYYKKIRMVDFKWYGKSYSDEIQVNVYENYANLNKSLFLMKRKK